MTKDTGTQARRALAVEQPRRSRRPGSKKTTMPSRPTRKSIDMETASKKPRLPVIGSAQAGLGEIYARTAKFLKPMPPLTLPPRPILPMRLFILRNEAVIFYQENNNAAETAAADEAIKIDPNQAILYYIKGQGLVANATVDPKTQSHRSASGLRGCLSEVS